MEIIPLEMLNKEKRPTFILTLIDDNGLSQPIDMAKMYQMGSLGGVVMRKRNSLPFLERSPRHRYPPTSNPSPRRMSWRQRPLQAGKGRQALHRGEGGEGG